MVDYDSVNKKVLEQYGFYDLKIEDFVNIAKDYEATKVLKTKLIPNPERIYAFAKAYELLANMAEERHGKIKYEVLYHGSITVTVDKFSVEGLDYQVFMLIVDCCSALNISATFHKLEIDLLIPDLFT